MKHYLKFCESALLVQTFPEELKVQTKSVICVNNKIII